MYLGIIYIYVYHLSLFSTAYAEKETILSQKGSHTYSFALQLQLAPLGAHALGPDIQHWQQLRRCTCVNPGIAVPRHPSCVA